MNAKAKELGTCKDRTTFVMKVLLLVLSVVVVVQLALFANNAVSLKDVNKRLDALEEEKIVSSKSLMTEKSEHGQKRAKRSTNETDIKKRLIKLEKLEER